MNDIVSVSPVIEQPAPEKRVWGAWATVGFGAVIIAAFVIAQTVAVAIPLIAMAFSQIDMSSGAPPEDLINQVMDVLNANLGLLQSIATVVSGIIGLGLILIIIKAKKGAVIAEYLGLNRISFKMVLLSVISVILFIAVADGIQILLGNETNEQIMYDIYDTSVWPWLFWVSVIIFAPLFEEAFFRGFLFEGFRQSRLGAAGAIIITAVVFGVMHSLQYSIPSVVWILSLGLLMGVVRWKTGTLWSTFIMHAIVNLVAMISMGLTPNT